MTQENESGKISNYEIGTMMHFTTEANYTYLTETKVLFSDGSEKTYEKNTEVTYPKGTSVIFLSSIQLKYEKFVASSMVAPLEITETLSIEKNSLVNYAKSTLLEFSEPAHLKFLEDGQVLAKVRRNQTKVYQNMNFSKNSDELV